MSLVQYFIIFHVSVFDVRIFLNKAHHTWSFGGFCGNASLELTLFKYENIRQSRNLSLCCTTLPSDLTGQKGALKKLVSCLAFSLSHFEDFPFYAQIKH